MNRGSYIYATIANFLRYDALKKDFYGYSAGMMTTGEYACGNTVPSGWKSGDWICNSAVLIYFLCSSITSRMVIKGKMRM
ncbi:hypothetical protein AgCh_005124 [Apium graveolens]